MSDRIYRVAAIGFAHMHINSLVQIFGNHPQVKLVACADTTPVRPEIRSARFTREWNMHNALENLGVAKAYHDPETLLENEKPDIVISCAENAQHAAITELCAAAGAHVVVEKPMASSLAHALRMARATSAAGVTLVTNWPTTWSGPVRAAQRLVEAGEIGRVLEVKWRGGSTGPLGSGAKHPGVTEAAAPMNGIEKGATWWHQEATGGGAMLDYCCYGSKLARWFIGEPGHSALGMKANLNSHWGDADDNAAMLVRFPGAMGLFEATWSTWDHGVPTGPIIYGTEGTLVVERKGDTQLVRQIKPFGEVVIHEGDPMPAGRATLAEDMIHHLETGDPLHLTLQTDFNLEVMAILDAGIRSAASGQLESVNSFNWEIGAD